MRFFLTGFMGCGKSFWGQRIAAKHHLHFIDLDEYIEEHENETIANLFATKGEPYFREQEHQYLNKAINENRHFIMACGGGTPCFHSNMNLMNEHGVTIYLNATADHLYKNLQQDESARPLLKKIDGTISIDFIKTMLLQREKFYTQSTHIVDAASMNETIFARIIETYV